MVKVYKKGIYGIVAILVTIFLTACSANNSKPVANVDTNSLTEKQWIEDIDYLHNNLPKYHKNLYHSLKKEDFDKEIMDLKNDVHKLKPYEIKEKLSELVASVGDAHTSLDLGFDGNNIYPIGLYWFGNDLRVVTADKQYKDIIGTKLTSINGVSIKELIDKVNKMIPHENDQWLKAINTRYITMPDVLKSLNVTTEDRSEFCFIDDNGNTKKLTLATEQLTPNNTIRAIK